MAVLLQFLLVVVPSQSSLTAIAKGWQVSAAAASLLEVELQVPIPVEMEGSDGATTVNAQHMQVDTQDRTPSTTVQTSQVDNSSSQHHASMVRYVDDNEIVPSLKKMDTDLK
ncbi:unnamed protein product [Sphagnum jensenii]|uniref:Uncharacterized protein n=1 Tax=Sphagnum jensenii TaxID=128206 RepID=A0ABP0ZZX8_9BRYO